MIHLKKVGDPARGKIFFQKNCALCHASSLGPGNSEITKQGPSLVGIIGRRSASSLNFNYTSSLSESGVNWNVKSLDRFLLNPVKYIPGTAMPVSVPRTRDRQDLIAFLLNLTVPQGVSLNNSFNVKGSESLSKNDPGDWHHDAPGKKHRITLADLPPPYATISVGNGPHVIKRPANAVLSVPPGFSVRLLAKSLSGPRIVRVAPNGDIFIAETRSNRIRVLRAIDGKDFLSQNQIFAIGLDRPFGIAFYPLGDDPRWIYVANNNSVVRFAYHQGDLKARGGPQVIISSLCDSAGGHTTRDIAFSRDGKRMFIQVGSGSNVAEAMGKRSMADIPLWESEHGRGAAWDSEANRADILVTDPEGHAPLHTFATGIRNGAGITVNIVTGDLWASTNERDGLGDNLVPDYLTRVKEGGFYGWPWYYLGNHEDPRHEGERPDLAHQVIVPDVLLQAHSAPLEMVFYTFTKGVSVFPKEFYGDVFVALHGSWNRTSRTGYKVVRVRLNHGVPTGEYDDFLTGFVVDNHRVWGRPVGVAVAHDGALLVTDDGNGTLWRISYK